MKRHRLWLCLVLLAALIPSGCGGGRLLNDVSIRPAVISPNADGMADIAEIKYTLARQSTISIYLQDAAGRRHVFRADQRRSKGERTAYLSGVIDGTLLPDGDYLVVLEASDERGRSKVAQLALAISGGDPLPLTINNLNIWPTVFTPNRDGITDRVTIGYSLSKEAARVAVYLLDGAGARSPMPEDKIRKMGSAGSHEHDYDAGVDLGATPPPDGAYAVVVEAEDVVGNQARVQGSLTIEGGGVPRVEVVNRAALIAPPVVPLGSALVFTCTVRNIGLVPVRTKGPASGTEYSSLENYNALQQYEEPGLFRLGMDFEGNSFGRPYPYRWQLGADDELTLLDTPIGPQRYLMPGQSVTVVGRLRLEERMYKTQPYFWVGLIHEQVETVQDRIEPTPITIAF
ncbi:MAG: hypothetical protein V1772_04265 [Chloroflexota bacterium]